tara:strand:- start:297 stop:473 length:177 start_codon:yes stop_codon:yes gene_type:complete
MKEAEKQQAQLTQALKLQDSEEAHAFLAQMESVARRADADDSARAARRAAAMKVLLAD